MAFPGPNHSVIPAKAGIQFFYYTFPLKRE